MTPQWKQITPNKPWAEDAHMHKSCMSEEREREGDRDEESERDKESERDEEREK